MPRPHIKFLYLQSLKQVALPDGTLPEEKILEIKPYLEKTGQVHGGRHPELLKIREEFNASAGELENNILFPKAIAMARA